jgi:hypothetical protein
LVRTRALDRVAREVADMTRSVFAIALVLGLGACGGSQSSEEGSTSRLASGTTETVSLEPLCVASRTQERTCQTQFLPALVALRVRLDVPAGITARDANEHDALLAEANTEFATDSTDANIAAQCAHMRAVPSDEAGQWRGLLDPCVALTDCAAFTECIVQFHEYRMQHELHH